MYVVVLDASRPSPSGPQVVRFRNALGSGTARWFGDEAVSPGEYTVELDIAREPTWGRELRPAEVRAPAIRGDGERIVLRGLLELTVDGSACLRLGPSLTLLGEVEGLPASADRTWAELAVDAGELTLFPFES